MLDSSKPILKKYNNSIVEYYIDYNHIKNLSFAEIFAERKDINDIDKDGFYLRIKYNNNEVVSAELTHTDCSLPCIRLDEETTRKLLNLLK